MTTTTDLNRLLWQERAAGDASRPWESLTVEPAGLAENPVELPGGLGLWLRPPGAPEDRVLLAVHGGGFVSGSISTHRRMFGHLALAAGMAALVVEYGLVPEHVYPAQLDQVSGAYQTVAGQRVAVVGDSCGGTLALGLALRAQEAGCLAPGVELDEFPGQLHTFQMAAGRSPAADDAIARAGVWLRRTLDS